MSEPRRTDCPGEETLAEFAGGSLAREAADAVEAHLDGCSECAWVAGRIIGDEVPSDPGAERLEVCASEASVYLLREVIGAGGMGTVYEAEDVRLGRSVALKLLREDPPRPGSKERFLREARITAMLEHPNIIPVLEMGEIEGGAPYYAVRLVRGGTLGAAIASRRDTASRLALLPHFRDLCNAIAYAHGKGVIHRDIKPGNVLVGSFGETVVVDWGLARQRDAAQEPLALAPEPPSPAVPGATQQGQALGTPGYMSPEQAAGRLEEVDERSDVYSLGAVLFEILMGRPPFTGTSEEEILRRVIVESPPHAQAQGVPPDLAAIAAKALSRSRAHRYADAAAMEADVAAFMDGRSVAAYRYGPLQVLRRLANRNRALTAGLLMTLLLGGAWAGSAWSRRQATRHREGDEMLVHAERFVSDSAWDRAAAYFVLARLADDRPEARWGEAALGLTGMVPLYKLRRHTGPVRAVAFSLDGSLLASAADDRTLRVVDAASGAQRFQLELREGPAQLAFGPAGELVAAVGAELELFDLRGGAAPERLEAPGPVRALAVARDDGRIAAAVGSEVLLWDRGSRALLGQVQVEAPVDALAFLPSGALVFGGAKLAGLRRFAPPLAPPFGPSSIFARRVVSCGGPRLAILDEAGDGHVLELASGQERAPAPPWSCSLLSLSPDCRTAICIGDSGIAQLWDLPSQEQFATVPGAHRQVLSVDFSPDSHTLAFGSADHAVRLWSLGDSRQHVGHLGPGLQPSALAWSPDGSTLASADRSGVLELWDAQSGEPRRALAGGRGEARAVAYASDGSWASAGEDGVRRWSAEGEPRGHPLSAPASALAFAPDGTLAAGGADGTPWLVAPGAAPLALPVREGELRALAFSPDGSRLASGDADGVVLLWDARARRLVAQLNGHQDAVSALAFSADGRWLVSGSGDQTLRLWSARDGVSHGVLQSDDSGEVRSLAFIPDAAGAPGEGLLFSATLPAMLELWDAARGQRLMVLNMPYRNRVAALAISPDGRRAALLHEDGVLKFLSLTGVDQLGSPRAELERLAHLYKYDFSDPDFGRDEEALRPPSERKSDSR